MECSEAIIRAAKLVLVTLRLGRDDFLKIRAAMTSTKIKGGKNLSQPRVMADFYQRNWESSTKGKAQQRDWHR